MYNSRNKFKTVAILLSMIFLGSCVTTPIRSYLNLNQTLDKELYASVGSVIFRLDRTSDLPNAFGGADIYGGKIDGGYSEVRLIGGGAELLIFESVDIFKSSMENTLQRYGDLDQGTNNTTVNIKNSDISKQGPEPVSRTIELNLDITSIIAISGHLIKITDFDGVNLRYIISEQ